MVVTPVYPERKGEREGGREGRERERERKGGGERERDRGRERERERERGGEGSECLVKQSYIPEGVGAVPYKHGLHAIGGGGVAVEDKQGLDHYPETHRCVLQRDNNLVAIAY